MIHMDMISISKVFISVIFDYFSVGETFQN